MKDPAIQRLEGRLDATGRRFGIIASRFNDRIVDRLLDGALDCLLRHGASPQDLTVVRVPGAWELSLALDETARTGRFDALVVLGVVIRGETPHFDYICGEASQGASRVSVSHRLPVGFGVLTCDTSAQAVERAGGKAGNKGWEAAHAALEMVDLLAQLRHDEPTPSGEAS